MIQLALKNLWRSQRLVLFLVMNLSLGFSGFVAIESFKSSLQNQIQSNSKNFLSADIAVTARRQITASEQENVDVILGDQVLSSEMYDFFAMLNIGNQSRLVLVKAIDDLFPLYGELELTNGKILRSNDSKEILLNDGIFVYPEIENEFDLKEGDSVVLGKLNLKVTGIIAKDTSQTFRAAGLAPRIFIHRELLPSSGLIQFGSTFTHSYLYKLKQFPLPPEKELEIIENIKKEIYSVISDPSLRVETPESAGEDSGRQLNYLSDFLGLVALVSLFLSALGAIYLIRLDLRRKLKEFAIFKSLGMSPLQFYQFYFAYFAFIGVMVCIPTAGISWGVVEIVGVLIRNLSAFELVVTFQIQALFLTFLFSLLGTFLICLPQIVHIQGIKASSLFAEGQLQQKLQVGNIFLYLPLVLAFLLLSFYQAKSYYIASLFIGILLFSFFALGFLGYLVLFIFLPKLKFEFWTVRLPLKSLERRKASSLALFVSLGLGALLLNILPQLKTSLLSEFEMNGVSKVPSLFMFDIQEEQIESLKSLVENQNETFVDISPLIRSRIIAVNGENFERKVSEDQYLTREEEAEVRFRNRGANISIRSQLSDAEVLVKGQAFSGKVFDPATDEIAELSIEERYAGRLGLKIGDLLTFDVQGVEVKGQIKNLRKVKWTSFQPNFFIIIQPGVLEEAPKTYIAALPRIDGQKRSEIQKKIVTEYPNVSVIDVERLVKEVLKIADQMSWSLQFMSALSLLLGYTILFSMILAQMSERRWEINLIKILGAQPSHLQTYLSFEYLIIAFAAGLVGSILSLGVSFGLSVFVFENIYVFDLFWPSATLIFIVFLTFMLTWFLTRGVLKEKPLGILKSS